MLAGIDIGGTFTDLVSWEEGRVRIYKLPSTPENPEIAFFRGLEESGMSAASRVVHGSTVAINALLERKGARTALVTTAGFTDVLSIGRQVRPRLYDLMVEREEPLIPAELCFGVDERMDPRGEVLEPLGGRETRELAERLRKAGVEAVAVCLLFSFANPLHERLLDEALRSLDIRVCLSSSILPEYREYERASTVAINAYTATVVEDYMTRLGGGLGGRELEIMHSGGGTMSTGEAVTIPARTLMSGPAGGVVAAAGIAEAAGRRKAISFDMGGTSTDVSLIDGGVTLTAEGMVAGLPLRFPMIDIHSIGAGGGSIARVDAGGALKVGPHSAGAYPGPACYGSGYLPTVTDANVVLGRLMEEHFLGGRMRLYAGLSERALGGIAGTLGWSIKETAAGLLSVVLAHMAGAVRVITVDRGHDPADFTLVAFGGAGPMHCCEMAEILGISQVIVPTCPGTLSAMGLLMADRVKDRSRTLMLDLDGTSLGVAEELVEEMKGDAAEDWSGEAGGISYSPSLDLRYKGQSYELMVPVTGEGWDLESLRRRFHRAHRSRYGYELSGSGIELVNVRLRSHIPSEVALSQAAGTPRAGKFLGETGVAFGIIEGEREERTCPVFDREGLVPGDEIKGPCLVVEEDATTVVPPRWSGGVDFLGNMVLERYRTC